MTRRAAVTPRWRTGDGVPLGELAVTFPVTFQGIVHALARQADIRAHVGDGAATFRTRHHTTTDLINMVHRALKYEGMLALDPAYFEPDDLAWAETQAARIWNGPTT